MNLMMPSIGFSKITQRELYDTMLKEMSSISQQIADGVPREELPKFRLENSQRFHRFFFTIYTGQYTGVCVCGRMEEKGLGNVGDGMSFDAVMPFVEGQTEHVLSVNEVVVERLVRDESYIASTGESAAGLTLVFSLQNPAEYLALMDSLEQLSGGKKTFSMDRISDLEDLQLQALGGTARLGALAVKGTVLLSVEASRKTEYPYLPDFEQVHKTSDETDDHLSEELLNAVSHIEETSHKQWELMSSAQDRLDHGENFYSVVDTLMLPDGSECDLYNVVGEIEEVLEDTNRLTKETLWILLLNCNGVRMTVSVPKKMCEGIPLRGRRFEGDIWLRGIVHLLPEKEDLDWLEEE